MRQFKYEDYINPPEVDWDAIFADFERHGLKLCALTELTGLPKSSIQTLRARGTEPKYSVGVVLLELHVIYCNESRLRVEG